jgi:hypothetical protein
VRRAAARATESVPVGALNVVGRAARVVAAHERELVLAVVAREHAHAEPERGGRHVSTSIAIDTVSDDAPPLV